MRAIVQTALTTVAGSEEIVKPSRRQFLQWASSAGALGALPSIAFGPRSAWAQTYPTRPIRLLVPTAPGTAPDTFARVTAQRLSERLGQPLVIENRPGAGNNIGTEIVVKAAPDGYTLLLVATANAVNATLFDKLNFNFIRDIVPIAGICRQSLVMVVHPSFPAKTIPEFIAYAKAHPGKISMASAGNGSSPHMAGELFKMMAGIDMVHVPYRGGAAALTDLLGGQVQMMFGSMAASIEFLKSGKLRPLAVTTSTRLEGMADVPAIAEFVPGYEATGFFGVGAPRNTPAAIVDKLNNEINQILVEEAIKARLAGLDARELSGSSAEFGKLLADETDKWGKVIKRMGIKAN
jgi:tripartite-type tricarboxylate transporter receptor subunit TctC